MFEPIVLEPKEIDLITAPLGSARTLPPKAYTSQQIFAAELQQIFYKEWICVAREDQIPNAGDYRSVSIVGQPLIIVRLKDGSIHGMSAICPHRSMPVTQGLGNTNSFQCPYHLWKFDLEGKLISAPHMENVNKFPSDNCNLKAVKTETWQGFIFLNLDADAQPLADRLPELNKITDGYRMKDMVVATSLEFDCPWNWKILIENFMEAYHHIGPHNESVQPNYNAKDSYVSGSVKDGWSVLHMPEAGSDDSAGDVEQHNDEGALPAVEGLSEKQQKEILASLIMPSFAWLNTPSLAFWYQLQPASYNQMRLIIHTLLPKEIAHGPGGKEIAEAVQETIQHIHLEDIAVNEGPWKGLQAPLTEQGQLSLLEESIWQMNQWWLQRLEKK